MNVDAEFLVEPVTERHPGVHVEAAIETVRAAGLSVQVGPFGTKTEGDAAAVLAVLAEAVQAAIAEGSTRITLSITPSES